MNKKLKPTFWKLSQGVSVDFTFEDMISSIDEKLVYVHRQTGAKGTSLTTQAEDFVNASIGDYFYLTNGNKGIYLLGQFTGPVNYFSKLKGDWMERPFRLIKVADHIRQYDGEDKWWTPNNNSTFIKVKEGDEKLFEELILKPYFGLSLKRFYK
ncbi:hypothetical protein NYR62_10530 [Actinobacillus genomosp. 1]|uniref:hypothetical protein n=1 Tax=Actinobacillus genomosp. 1 TaxID=254839 RepID=UPI0024431A2C|nr:hypothetical protein [Actinobacillus genomosp. 1]WGE36006.1 hypothetical protein NYR62_10530 [Actinobacillus genomosp. 1]